MLTAEKAELLCQSLYTAFFSFISIFSIKTQTKLPSCEYVSVNH